MTEELEKELVELYLALNSAREIERTCGVNLYQRWTYVDHPFNNKNPIDLAKLAEWQERAKTSKYYENAITTWTMQDPAKIAMAKANKLNYRIYYKESELFE